MSWFDRFRRRRRPDGAEFFGTVIDEINGALAAAVGRPLPERIASPTAELANKVVPAVPGYDPLWLHNGVWAFEPVPEQPYWVYVTRGLCMPWHVESAAHLATFSPDDPSAAGYELTMATPEFTDWPILILNVLMLVGLSAWSGRDRNARPYEIGERIPLKPMGMLFPDTRIEGLITQSSPFGEGKFTVRSGHVTLIHLLGITKAEYAWLIATDASLHAEQIAKLGDVTDFGRSTASFAEGCTPPAEQARWFTPG